MTHQNFRTGLETFFFGRKVLTKQQALKSMKDAAVTAYIFGGFTILIGSSRGFGVVISGLLLCVLGFFIQKKQSRIAALLMVAFAIFEGIGRLVTGMNGLITPIIILYFGYKGLIATYSWHKFGLETAEAAVKAN